LLLVGMARGHAPQMKELSGRKKRNHGTMTKAGECGSTTFGLLSKWP
jgi:hypothetical protein